MINNDGAWLEDLARKVQNMSQAEFELYISDVKIVKHLRQWASQDNEGEPDDGNIIQAGPFNGASLSIGAGEPR